jgi:phosphate:Na+ symporter
MDIFDVISLLSGVALFLFGMSLMSDSLKKLAGNRLECLLYRLTNTSWKGVLLGTGVTAVIQSSSATSVMVVGFVNSGMMRFRQAIGIVLGAILGTSVTGWVVCLSSIDGGSGWIQWFSTSTMTGIIAILGMALRIFGKKPSRVHLGSIMLGFAVLMFGIDTMSSAVAPLKESADFINILTVFSNPLLGVLVGALFACVLQSASAAVGVLQALTVTGAVDFATAFPIIMGIAIGAAVPVLLSAIGANTDGKRTAFVYLLIDVLGAAICGVVFYGWNAIDPFPFLHRTMTVFSIALLNSIFRLLVVLVLFPFLDSLEKITCWLIKDRRQAPVTPSDPIQLEERFLPYPSLAISQCREFMNAMAQNAKESLRLALAALSTYDPADVQRVIELETQSDRYEDRIGTYLVKLTRNELDGKENAEVSKFLHTLPDLERIFDHTRSIAVVAQEIDQKSIVYSDDARRELSVIQAAVTEILSITVEAFTGNDLTLAAKVEPLTKVIGGLCNQMKLHHVARLQSGECAVGQGFTFNDLLMNYERIADHCSNIALAMLELETDSYNTHEYLSNLEHPKQDAFAEYFAEFQRRYTV